ncbi:hypothetical protein ACS0TY_026041 [Phlomoides rotata]
MAAAAAPKNKKMDCQLPWSESDEEMVKSVVEGKIPSYALESKLGDCGRAAAIRREALQRITRTQPCSPIAVTVASLPLKRTIVADSTPHALFLTHSRRPVAPPPIRHRLHFFFYKKNTA